MTSLPVSVLPTIRTSLQSFVSSRLPFEILKTIPEYPPFNRGPPPPSYLLVLDSSFNPPTKAHLHLAISALKHEAAVTKESSLPSSSEPWPRRLLLLLATQNATKPAKPASFEDRIAMMTAFANDILDTLDSEESHDANKEEGGSRNEDAGLVEIKIGVTKHPYFIDKVGIASTFWSPDGNYGLMPTYTGCKVITGFDTLLNILDTKYYPPRHTLEPLRKLFGKHKLLVAYRTEDEWGGKEEQDAYLKRLRQQNQEKGWKKDWAKSIEMVEGKNSGDEAVSSTRAREAAGEGDREALEALCSKGVVEWILERRLYGGLWSGGDEY